MLCVFYWWLHLASCSCWVVSCATATSTVLNTLFNGVHTATWHQWDISVTLWRRTDISLCPGALYQALGVAPTASRRTIRLACLGKRTWMGLRHVLCKVKRHLFEIDELMFGLKGQYWTWSWRQGHCWNCHAFAWQRFRLWEGRKLQEFHFQDVKAELVTPTEFAFILAQHFHWTGTVAKVLTFSKTTSPRCEQGAVQSLGHKRVVDCYLSAKSLPNKILSRTLDLS